MSHPTGPRSFSTVERARPPPQPENKPATEEYNNKPSKTTSAARDETSTSPETDTAPADFAFTASQIVDRVLEVFNSDAPAAARRAALGECFAADGLEVASLLGERRVTMSGARAVDAVANASESVAARAEPKLRVFMEPGVEDDDDDDDDGDGDGDGARAAEATTKTLPPNNDDAPTLCLDVYPADETPGLSAVVKGRPAPTVVLWRAHRNRLTHAWLAPDRDGFAKDWAAVTEDALLNAKVMTHVNAVLTEHLPASHRCWDFHFNNYELDIDVI